MGARHPINKPNTTPWLRNVSQEVSSQTIQGIHTSTRMKFQAKGERSDWFSHLTGLIGWWRRVESEQEKMEEKTRKMTEVRKNSSVAKLSFVSNLWAQKNRHEKSKLATPRKLSIDRKKSEKIEKIVLSPSTKRKAGGWRKSRPIMNIFHLEKDKEILRTH